MEKDTVYNGIFINDLYHGKGEMDYRNGSYFEGEWRFGKKHGFGTYTFPNGAKAVGLWIED